MIQYTEPDDRLLEVPVQSFLFVDEASYDKFDALLLTYYRLNPDHELDLILHILKYLLVVCGFVRFDFGVVVAN